jgi:hypothetical protein
VRLNLRIEADPGSDGASLRWKGRVVSLTCEGREQLLDHLAELHVHYGSTADEVVRAAVGEAERLLPPR